MLSILDKYIPWSVLCTQKSTHEKHVKMPGSEKNVTIGITFVFKIIFRRGFLGGSVVGTPSFHYRGCGFNPMRHSQKIIYFYNLIYLSTLTFSMINYLLLETPMTIDITHNGTTNISKSYNLKYLSKVKPVAYLVAQDSKIYTFTCQTFNWGNSLAFQ